MVLNIILNIKVTLIQGTLDLTFLYKEKHTNTYSIFIK